MESPTFRGDPRYFMESSKVSANVLGTSPFPNNTSHPRLSFLVKLSPSGLLLGHIIDKAGMWPKTLDILGLPCHPFLRWGLPIWPSVLPCHWLAHWVRRSMQTAEARSSFYVSAHGPLNYASFHLHKLGQERDSENWPPLIQCSRCLGQKINKSQQDL